jgi:threonine aldolase
MADPTGFEPAISSVTGWHVGPLHHGSAASAEDSTAARGDPLAYTRRPVHQIDLRSDTVTRPTPEMRRAMAEAEVGDDVFGDDPTVIELEARAAELLGKEAGLFVASGTMGNLVAQLAHLARGQETIAGREHHIVVDEAAGHAVIVGTSIRQLAERPDGTLDPDEVEAAFRDPSDPHEPITGLISLENTHAHSMGQPLTPAYEARIAAIAHEHKIPLHIDGARFWNAAITLGVSGRDLARPADSVTFCLSKGLACPVGSVVVGDKDFIWRARRGRKLVGGGMRQVGILAAAGLVALRDGSQGMIERLAEDHANARRLAEALAELPGIVSPGGIAQTSEGPLDPGRVRTNFVLFRVERDRAAFIDALAARGVVMVAYPHGQIRAATHYGVSAADIETTIAATRAVLKETATTESAESTEATNGTEANRGARTAVTARRTE